MILTFKAVITVWKEELELPGPQPGRPLPRPLGPPRLANLLSGDSAKMVKGTDVPKVGVVRSRTPLPRRQHPRVHLPPPPLVVLQMSPLSRINPRPVVQESKIKRLPRRISPVMAQTPQTMGDPREARTGKVARMLHLRPRVSHPSVVTRHFLNTSSKRRWFTGKYSFSPIRSCSSSKRPG